MKRMSCLRLAVAAFAGLYLQSCALDEYFESRVEQYTKAFIKEFGLVDPEQDWTMGQNANAEINVGATARSVKIYGKYGDTYYKVADLNNVGGQLSVPVHVPKTCTEMLVKVDGRSYYGKFGSSLNCTGVAGRGIAVTDDEIETNRNPVEYTRTVGPYTVEVKHTDKGNDPEDNRYQRFNTQQMGPLVANDVWSDYYSLNTEKMTYNTDKAIGILPESGVFNANKAYLDKVLEGSEVAVDFSVDAGDNGTFTFFPYYYGTNLVHELGVYLLDEKGDPIKDVDGYLKLPIFVDNDEGDMQIQPHYCSDIDKIKVFDKNGKEVNYDNPIELNVDETYDLDVRLYDKNSNEILYDDEFKKNYHSRIAFHAWVDDKVEYDAYGVAYPVNGDRFGKVFVTCDANGRITAKLDTRGYGFDEKGRYWMQTGIATGLSKMEIQGTQVDFPIIVKDPNKEQVTITYGLDIPDGVDTEVGETNGNLYVCIDNNNIKKFGSLSSLWGDDFLGVDDDEAGSHYHCLYERDGNDLKHNKTATSDNIILAGGKIALLYNDIKTTFNDEHYAIENQYDDKTPKDSYSDADYDVVGLKLNAGKLGWTQCFLYLQERNGGPASIKSRNSTSRAEIPAEYRKMLTPDNSIGWLDVHRSWSRFLPAGKEVASYPVDQPMLARTRGYDVTITNSDGSPFRGKFGMYISIKKAFNTDEAVLQDVKPYTLYSQQKLNQYGQRSAAAFKHPKSDRTFFTFEDMDLTHKAEDEGGYKYGEYEFSSDRDVNDLIFLISGFKEIDGDKKITEKEEVNEEGFKWIWALEDLGSTGDFDFNDVVMQIGDITVTKTTQNAGGVEGNTTQEIVRELRFKPLAAGGTLPVHIHLKYNGQDYTLAPGEYDLTKGEAPEGAEWHKWFGNYQSTQMLNTGLSAHITTSDANTCVLIVDKNQTVGDFLTGETYGDGATKQNVLYVVVQGDGDETFLGMQAVDQDRMSSEDAYMIPLPKKGFAAQSFFILGDDGGTWRWMQEYNHICLGYPDFAEWINNPTKEWTKKSDPNYLYNRGK